MPHHGSSEEQEEEEEVYPPWLENIVNGEYYDHVRVLQYDGERGRAQAAVGECRCYILLACSCVFS